MAPSITAQVAADHHPVGAMARRTAPCGQGMLTEKRSSSSLNKREIGGPLADRDLAEFGPAGTVCRTPVASATASRWLSAQRRSAPAAAGTRRALPASDWSRRWGPEPSTPRPYRNPGLLHLADRQQPMQQLVAAGAMADAGFGLADARISWR